jgi:hypothetical protein
MGLFYHMNAYAARPARMVARFTLLVVEGLA